MFELVLTLCLHGNPKDCVEQRVANRTPASLIECMQRGPGVSKAAASAFDGHTLRTWRCASQIAVSDDAKALAVPSFALERVADGVFVHTGQHDVPTPENRGDLSNFGFIIGEEAVAVIDTGGSALVAQDMLKAIRARTDLPIRYLILTHMHPDHVLGASVFADEGAQIVGHRKLERALAARAGGYETSLRRLMGAAAFKGSKIVAPDIPVEAEMRIDLGGRTLLLEAHPTAHTDNDLTILDEETQTWFLGDLVFLQHLPALDGSLIGWLALLKKFQDRDIARVVPGHGPASVPWPEGADPLNAYLSGLAKQTRAAIRKGTTLHEATQQVGAEFEGEWLLFEEFNARNVTAAFQELEWE